MAIKDSLVSMATSAVSKLVGTPASLIVVKSPKPETIPIQFNPAEYQLTEGTSYHERKRIGKDAPVTTFAGSESPKLSMTLYFDSRPATDLVPNPAKKEDDVGKKVEKIAKLMKIEGEEHSPPAVIFVWGSLKFVGVITRVVSTYTMFDQSGKPLRAKAEIEIQGLPEEDGDRRSPFSSPDRTKARLLTEDNNIWNIAEREYGTRDEWRRIAEANGIMDPLSIPVGTVLKVPSI